ncbi:MAG: carbohydrate-binding domain-containing protein [Clostridia bacterium]|nr:carbohydrate-binding domain-containing protein [Clostridia bacterium]
MSKKWIVLVAMLALIAVFATACDGLTSLTGLSGDNVATSSAGGGADGGAGASDLSAEEIAAASQEVADTLSETASEDYLDSELVEVSAEQQVATTTEEGAIEIDLSLLTSESKITGAKYADDVLTIKAAGTYVLTGTLNGAVVVDKNIEGTVRLVLAGATIKTLDSQASAAIVFSKSDDQLRILTIADGTVNEVSDSVGDTAADGDGAAIQAKKSSLTINGSGTLKVTAVGEEANGIKVKNTLTVLSANIEVTAVKNGIKADNLIEIKGATLTVTAGNDGIKTDIEPETEEEAVAYAKDSQAGYIYIENSTITVTATDDGIAANGCLYIANRTEDVITITTNGGAPTTVTEKSSDAADGKALKVAGIVLEDEEGNETLYPADFGEESAIDNYALVITGGTFRIDSNDDAIHSKGNVLVSGGVFEIASGDDGIHAEYLTKIAGGTITITKGYEGIEGAAVEITGGEIAITVVDDGVNAANADLKNYAYYILITDGKLTVNCSGDGLDSNGKLLISGGEVLVFGPVNGGNSALDSETGTTISGGTVIATCREAMDPVGATQYMVVANVNVSAGTVLTLKDNSGATVLSFTAPKACSNVTISTPDLRSGTYTLSYGNSSVNLTATTGTAGGMGGNMGGNMGGQGGMGGGPGGNQGDGRQTPGGRPSGVEGGQTPPALPNGEEGQDGDDLPEMPQNGGQFDGGMTPPEFPTEGQTPFDGTDGGMTPPEMPNGEQPQEGMTPPAMPGNDQGGRQGGAPFGNGGFPPFGNGGRNGGFVPNESLEAPVE